MRPRLTRRRSAPSASARARLAVAVDREVQATRVRVEEALLRGEAHLHLGQYRAAADALAEQHALLAGLRTRVEHAVADAAAEREAEWALAHLGDLLGGADLDAELRDALALDRADRADQAVAPAAAGPEDAPEGDVTRADRPRLLGLGGLRLLPAAAGAALVAAAAWIGVVPGPATPDTGTTTAAAAPATGRQAPTASASSPSGPDGARLVPAADAEGALERLLGERARTTRGGDALVRELLERVDDAARTPSDAALEAVTVAARELADAVGGAEDGAVDVAVDDVLDAVLDGGDAGEPDGAEGPDGVGRDMGGEDGAGPGAEDGGSGTDDELLP